MFKVLFSDALFKWVLSFNIFIMKTIFNSISDSNVSLEIETSEDFLKVSINGPEGSGVVILCKEDVIPLRNALRIDTKSIRNSSEPITDEDKKSYRERRLISDTSLQFVDWFDPISFNYVGLPTLGKTLFELFTESNPDFSKGGRFQLSIIKFNSWLEFYGLNRFGQSPMTRRVGPGREFTFSFHPSRLEVRI